MHSYNNSRSWNPVHLITAAVVLLLLIVIIGAGGKEDVRSNSSSRPAYASYSAGSGTTLYTSRNEWYEGGSLHNATVTEWKRANNSNKLATAADWLAATTWKGHLTSHSAFDRMKDRARKLVNGIDGATIDLSSNDLGDVLTAKEIAASLIAMSNDLGP